MSDSRRPPLPGESPLPSPQPAEKERKCLYLGTYCVLLCHPPEDARQEHVAQSRRDEDDEGVFMDC